MLKLRQSLAARLVLGYGLLGSISIFGVSAVFYVGTIGALDEKIDGRIQTVAERMLEPRGHRNVAVLTAEVQHQLSDGIDSDREIFLLQDRSGHIRAGNLSACPALATGRLESALVVRGGQTISARLYQSALEDGGLLIVGRDLSEHQAIRRLVWRAMTTGAALSLALTLVGALLFRRQVEARLAIVRSTAEQIEAGDLSRRIPEGEDNEFGRLNRDINRMLDRIERLMEGVRHVSNAIAHDLRTPLGRVRSKLDDALRHPAEEHMLARAAADAIDDIDDLIRLFERLLQIAEAESGVRGRLFEVVDLNRIVQDIAEMYEASAEDIGATLTLVLAPQALGRGDRNLLGSAVASLLDNALKYAGPGAGIVLRTEQVDGKVALAVCDNGPGIPVDQLGRVRERFYRLDQSRHLPGNGLGLSIVDATAKLHDGELQLADARPGLIARIVLPAAA